MVLNRERSGVLIALIVCALGLSGWIIWKGIDTYRNSFPAGSPPKDVEQVIVPTTVDVTKLRPPAIKSTDQVRYGGVTSSLAIIEYGDYECEDCKALSETLRNELPTYNGAVRFVFHHLPIESKHPKALDAAVFAECAGTQGAFWEAHDALMQAPQIDESVFTQIANAVRLDRVALNACRSNQDNIQRIRDQVEIARGDGINGVPLLFIGTHASYGEMTAEELRSEISRYLNP